MYCRLPNAVQPCPKRAPRFVRRQTFRRVRVSAIISPPSIAKQQFSSSRQFPPSNMYLRNEISTRLKLRFSYVLPIFEVSHVAHPTHCFLVYWPFSRNHPRVTSTRLDGLGQPPRQDGKRKEEKGNKKEKTIDAAKRTVAMKEGGMGRKGILARGYHDLSRYKVENVDDRASSRRFHVADARQKASTAAKIIGAFPLIPDTRVTRSISME